MKTANLEKREDLGDFLYHIRELLELRDRVGGLVERLDSSLGRDTDATETVIGELETELFFHLPYHISELREPFERVLKELYGDDARILVDQEEE
jgi:hypothetical protein